MAQFVQKKKISQGCVSMNFIVLKMTYMRYFMPLIIEGNRRGIKSRVFFRETKKYNNPCKYKHVLKKLSEDYNFRLNDNVKDVVKYKGVTMLVEGSGIQYLSHRHKIYSIATMTDFRILYRKYIDRVNYVIFPSRKFAKHYGTISHKNLYLGSPKYDIQLDRNSILEKYGLSAKDKYALVIYPKLRDLPKIDIPSVYKVLQDKGYKIIVKARGKDSVAPKNVGDYFFKDFCWFPHSSLELMHISDLVVCFGSTAIKECAMMERPIINFNVKKHKHLSFLYGYRFLKSFDDEFDRDVFDRYIEEIEKSDFSKDFKRCRTECLFEKGASRRILKIVMGEKN